MMERGKTPMERAIAMLNLSSFGIGTFALPFVQSFFPASHLAYVCMFDIGNSILALGGTYTLTRFIAYPGEKVTIKKVLKSLFSSLPFCTYILVFILAALNLKLPNRLLIVTNIAGNANAFLCMLMIGIMLNVSLPKSKVNLVLKYLASRYLVIILFGAAVFLFVPLDLEIKKVIAILLSAPIAQMEPIFSLELDLDNGIPAAMNSISIVVSIFVMTGLIVLLA